MILQLLLLLTVIKGKYAFFFLLLYAAVLKPDFDLRNCFNYQVDNINVVKLTVNVLYLLLG